MLRVVIAVHIRNLQIGFEDRCLDGHLEYG